MFLLTGDRALDSDLVLASDLVPAASHDSPARPKTLPPVDVERYASRTARMDIAQVEYVTTRS